MKYIIFGNMDNDMRLVLYNIPYEIDYIVANCENDTEFEGKHVYTSIKLYDERLDEIYVFITDLNNYPVLADQLVKMGFIEGKHFSGALEYLYNQWEQTGKLNDIFTVRVKHMSEYISCDSKSVMDLGCGKQHLRRFLKPEVNYIGVDYTGGGYTVICNFNEGEYPTECADTVFCSGCLEYIVDVETFISKICRSAIKEVVVSYCPLEYKIDIWERRRYGWKNHMTINQLIDKFTQYGFNLEFAMKSIDVNVIFKFLNNCERHN